ncbi:MAG: hypothetical protein J6C29_06885 [Clostridia bacterium]|nr:hypothetical protein [Clostridia bacterium]
MARIGFRSAMFGFNKSDVNLYLMKLQQEYSLKEQELLKKVADLEKENLEIKQKSDQNEKELLTARGELSYFKGKEQEIEQMSESIGTMYMVAMQNAQEIIGEAEATAHEINQISSLRLEAAAKAEQQLKAIKESIKSSAEQFAEDINSMSLSLEGPKNRLAAQLEGKKLPEIPVMLENDYLQD